MTDYQYKCTEWISDAIHEGYYKLVIINVLQKENDPNLCQLSEIECCNLMNEIWSQLPDSREIHGPMFNRLCDLCVIDEDYEGEEDVPAF